MVIMEKSESITRKTRDLKSTKDKGLLSRQLL